jgi:hypothetical protein
MPINEARPCAANACMRVSGCKFQLRTTREGKPSPRGVTSPKPVTTTLRIAYLMDGDALVRKVAEEEVRAVLATVAVQIV